MSRHNLFFTPEQETGDFHSVLQQVQEYIAGQHSELLSDGNANQAKANIKRYIAKFVQDSRVAVKGMTQQQLVDALYTEMAEYSFLTKYIFADGIEEIDINSWRDIEIQYAGGRCEKLMEHFDSPEHCINVLRRMLHVSGTILDDQSPLVVGTLAENIRIAVMKSPIVDANVGAAASIRIVNPNHMEKEDFIDGGTATAEMLDLLSEFIRYGISVCIAGATSSGKTTVAGWLLTTIPDNKRIFTIENGSRELSLIREKDGKVTNSVVHTLTRNSENELYRIEQIDLVDISLRFNPDIIVVGEMRGAEANAAQEVARTGVAVVTTIHSNSCESTYRRMVSLCKRAVDMSDETLMGYVTEAYPIVVFCKQLENKQRRLMEQLGRLYLTGTDIPKNVPEAVKWLTLSSDLGNAYAGYALAKLYLTGDGVSKNVGEAIRLFTLSSEKKNEYAAYQLGKLYLFGEDVPKDIETAIRWLTASAEQGNQFAQYALGKLYFYDGDVSRDKEKSLYWLGLSAAQGNIYAQYLIDNINSYRNPSALLAATRLMHRLENLFREDYRRTAGIAANHIDRKRRRKLQKKKQAQGHKRDDHAPQIHL